MCLILAAVRERPDLPLVIAANRDEFFRRPTRRAGYWADAPDVLGGRDLEAGGSWMAVDTRGRMAAVTNVREPPRKKSGVRSRGLLVSDYLSGETGTEAYLEGILAQRHRYDAFNLLLGASTDLYFYSNRQRYYQPLDSGLYGISNGELDCPWPKVDRGKAALRTCLRAAGSVDEETLFEILADRTVADDAELPDTGVGPELERRLSPPFVHMDGYGTRSSTLIMLDVRGRLTFVERYFAEDAGIAETRRFRIDLGHVL